MSGKEKLILLFCACSYLLFLALMPDNPVSKQALEKPSLVQWDTVKDDSSQKYSLSWMGIHTYPRAKEGSWGEKKLEEVFNIDLKPLIFDSNNYTKRRPLMLAGGDVPDVMWDGDPSAVRINIRNGFIMEIPLELILKVAPTYVKKLNTYGKEAWLYSNYNGKNFGLPTFANNLGKPRIGAWRKDWLTKVGIEKVPTSLEEMEEAFRRFTFNDPDGNGKDDTYGWFPALSHWSYMYADIFAAFDILAFEFQEDHGVVVWGGLQPNAKKALALLKKWYAEKLLNPDHLLSMSKGIGGNASETSFLNGKSGYLYPLDLYVEYQRNAPRYMASKLWDISGGTMVPSRPLKNSKGIPMGRTWGGACHVLQFGKHLEKTPEKVLRILKMMENIASDDKLYLEVSTGKRGYHWDLDAQGEYTLLGEFAHDRHLQDLDFLGSSTPYYNIFFFPSSYQSSVKSNDEEKYFDTYMKPEWSLRNALGKCDVLPSAEANLNDLVRLQTIAYVNFITGNRSLDEFDDFVKEWKSRGGELLLKEANLMNVSKHIIFQKMGAEIR